MSPPSPSGRRGSTTTATQRQLKGWRARRRFCPMPRAGPCSDAQRCAGDTTLRLAAAFSFGRLCKRILATTVEPRFQRVSAQRARKRGCLFSTGQTNHISRGQGAIMAWILRSLISVFLLAVIAALPRAAEAQVAAPSFSKAFSPDTIGPGGTSTLTFTIDNLSGAPVTDLAFTDNLPAAVTMATPAAAINTCTGGTLSAPDGGGTITYSGGSLGAGASCTVSVNVTSSTPGMHTNTSGDLTSSAGNSGTATDDLTVSASVPGFTKAFSPSSPPSSIPLFGTATLTYTIDASAVGSSVFSMSFTETLPTGLVIAAPSNSGTTCVGTLTAEAGSSSISFFSGFVGPGDVCTLSVDVTSDAAGTYVAQSSNLTSSAGSSGSSVDALTVTGPAPGTLQLTKQFLDDPAAPGGSATLEFRLNNAIRGETITDIAFTDDLGAMLSGAAFGSTLFDNCGGTAGGSGTFSYSGGALGDGANCMVRIAVNIPGGASSGSYPNTTSNVTGTSGSGPVTGDPASDTLVVSGVAQLTKTFTTPSITAGQGATMEFTIENPSTTDAMTDITFTDNLTAFLSGVTVTGGTGAGVCGAGSNLFVFSSGGDTILELAGGNLAAGADCTFSVTLGTPAETPGDTYLNTTSQITATVASETVIGPADSASLTVNGGVDLGLRKSFTPGTVSVDGATDGAAVLDITIDNSEGTAAVTDIAFSDDLDAMLSGAQVVAATSDTCEGTVTSSYPASTFTYEGGSVAGGSICTISLDISVPAAAATGSYTNTISDLAGMVGATTVPANTASATLNVLGADDRPVVLTKQYLGGPFLPGQTATLEFTITNPNATNAASGIFFTYSLNAGLSGLASVSGTLTDICGTGSSITGTTLLIFTGGSLASAGDSCTFSVDVAIPAGAPSGDYINSTSNISATVNGSATTGDPASDVLQIDSALLELEKQFATSPVAPGDNVLVEFTLTNPTGQTVSDLTFTDDFDAMLPGATLAGSGPHTCNGAFSAMSAGAFSYQNASLLAGESCVVRATAAIPAGAATGEYTNTTSQLTGDAGGVALTGPAASDTLRVQASTPPEFSKVFAPDSGGPGTSTTVTYTINNSGSGSLSNLRFADVFDGAIPGAVVTSAAAGSCDGVPVISGAGTGSVAVSGLALGPSQTCEIIADVSIPASAASGSFEITTTPLQDATTDLGVAAADTFTVIADGPVFTKDFTPDTIDQGAVTTLSFFIDNVANSVPANDMGFTDPFPAGMEVASPANASNGCGGTFTANPGDGSVALSGGSIVAGEGCSIEVDVRATSMDASLTNTTSVLTSTLLDTAPASATLTITPAAVPGFSKVFAPDVIDQGESSTLTYTIDNSANSIEAADLAFTDDFPAGLVVASPASVSNTCGGTVTAASGSATLELAGGTLGAGADCTISVDLQGLDAGVYDSDSSTLASTLGTSPAASDSLTVNALPLGLVASFAPAVIEQFETSTLTYEFGNSASIAASAISLSDTLPADVTITDPAVTTNTCGGTLSAPDGGSEISLSGAGLAAGQSCSVSVTVISGVVDSYVNDIESASSSLGASSAASATLEVEPATMGELIIVQNTDTDGTFDFTSTEPALNFSIATSGGTGSAGPISLTAGTYVVTQTVPAGAGISAISCTDSDSTGDVDTGQLTVNLAVLETVTCTFTSIGSEQKTVDTINRFLTKRADLILSSEPSNARRLDRLKRGVGSSKPVRFTTGDLKSFLPFDAQISTSSKSLSFSTSLLQAREAAASFALAHDGDPGGVRHVENTRWDAWFEAQYKEFDTGPNRGHFAIAYLGADYLVSDDLLIGALVQFDNMEDRSSAENSTADGTGWMFGPYMTARIAPNLYFDGRLAAGTSRNSVSPYNTYTDDFSTSRWMATAELIGEFQRGNWTIQPTTSLSYFEERQDGYVDSVGVTIPSQTVSLGQFKFGPTFRGQFRTGRGTSYSPYFSLDAIYNFGDTDGVTLSDPDSASTDGWRGRFRAGVDFRMKNGASLSLGGTYDGIGQDDLDIWGLSFELNIPM
ncbi:autotransporter outer membrane beta-barrel domain-containing protein [Rhodobacteraceae bacterium 63075]|nr:autotransporter outer membrane beta-barrel domain-containing protein [Rhodobacteraceae bacterium 63075]